MSPVITGRQLLYSNWFTKQLLLQAAAGQVPAVGVTETGWIRPSREPLIESSTSQKPSPSSRRG